MGKQPTNTKNASKARSTPYTAKPKVNLPNLVDLKPSAIKVSPPKDGSKYFGITINGKFPKFIIDGASLVKVVPSSKESFYRAHIRLTEQQQEAMMATFPGALWGDDLDMITMACFGFKDKPFLCFDGTSTETVPIDVKDLPRGTVTIKAVFSKYLGGGDVTFDNVNCEMIKLTSIDDVAPTGECDI